MTNPLIPYNYRALVVAPAGHSNTNGRVWRYFLTFEEACRAPRRIGPPEYSNDGVRGPRPDWLQDLMTAQPQLVWC